MVTIRRTASSSLWLVPVPTPEKERSLRCQWADGAAIPPCQGNPEVNKGQGRKSSVAMLIKRPPVGQIATAATIARRVASNHHDQQSTTTRGSVEALLVCHFPRLATSKSRLHSSASHCCSRRSLRLHEMRAHDYIKTGASTVLRVGRLAFIPKRWNCALVFSAARERSGASSRMDTDVANRCCPMQTERLQHTHGAGQHRNLAPGVCPFVSRGKRAHWLYNDARWLATRARECASHTSLPVRLCRVPSQRPGMRAPDRRADKRPMQSVSECLLVHHHHLPPN